MKPLGQFAIFAVIGQVVLLARAWLLPLVSQYRLVGDNISELVLGRYGFIQTAAFVISGLGAIGLSYALRRQTGSRGSFVGSLLIGIYGAGALVVAIFPTDRIDNPSAVWSQSTTGTIHGLTALVSYLCVIVGMFVLTWTFAHDARWRSLVVWSSLLAGAALALLFVQAEGPWGWTHAALADQRNFRLAGGRGSPGAHYCLGADGCRREGWSEVKSNWMTLSTNHDR
jgi:Protein of unknown function (DUF998)